MPTTTLNISGGCRCGDIRYAAEAETESRQLVLCHCEHCQKPSGTGHTHTLGVPADALRWTGRGNTRSYAMQSATGTTVENHFCGKCGSPVAKRFRERRMDIFAQSADIWAIHAGSLDASSIESYEPDFKIFLHQKMPWDKHV